MRARNKFKSATSALACLCICMRAKIVQIASLLPSHTQCSSQSTNSCALFQQLHLHSRFLPQKLTHTSTDSVTVEMHFEDLERHECTVNSSELAKRPGEHLHQRPALTTTVRTPSEATLFGKTCVSKKNRGRSRKWEEPGGVKQNCMGWLKRVCQKGKSRGSKKW